MNVRGFRDLVFLMWRIWILGGLFKGLTGTDRLCGPEGFGMVVQG